MCKIYFFLLIPKQKNRKIFIIINEKKKRKLKIPVVKNKLFSRLKCGLNYFLLFDVIKLFTIHSVFQCAFNCLKLKINSSGVKNEKNINTYIHIYILINKWIDEIYMSRHGGVLE